MSNYFGVWDLGQLIELNYCHSLHCLLQPLRLLTNIMQYLYFFVCTQLSRDYRSSKHIMMRRKIPRFLVQ